MAQTEALPGKTKELCRAFLRSLGQTVKLVSLYKSGHPVPASATQESWQLLQELFSASDWPEAAFALTAGRWVVNDAVLEAEASTFELLALVYRGHALVSLTFTPEVKLYEFTALCEMAATPANRAYETDASDFLKERGVKHIRVNVEEYVRAKRVRRPASAMIENPVARRAGEAPRPGPGEGNGAKGQGFGSFIKSLVEKSIDDPQERAKVYAEAVQLVEQALARHVSEATHKLLLEKQGVLNERLRAEHVLAKVANGKVIVDKEGRVLMMDPAAEEIAGKQFAAVAGKPILETLGMGEKMLALSKDLAIPENRPVSDEVDFAGEDEVLKAFRQSMALVQDEHGRFVGTYAELPHMAKFREAMKLQESFVANITHDLKAPLASICSALEIISQRLGSKLGEEEASFLDISLRNSRVLKQMIGEILDFSKLQSGRMTVRLAAAPVEAMVREAVEALKPWASSRKIALEFAPPSRKLRKVLADHGRVVQILSNLVSNAIKFTPDNGRIDVMAEKGKGPHGGQIVVSVRDTGCGIASEDQKKIFEKFSQIVGEGHRREGVGLGLAIVKELVAMHHGELWVESELERGSIFSFSLREAGRAPGGDARRGQET